MSLILCSEHSLSALEALESNMLRVSGQVGTDGCSLSGVLYVFFLNLGMLSVVDFLSLAV